MGNPRRSSGVEAAKTLIPCQAEDSDLSWSVHLIARYPRRQAQIAATLAGVFILGVCVLRSFWLSFVPALALFFSLSEFIFPIRYLLTEESASARYGLTALEIRWEDVRHAYLTDDGIKLSPLAARNSRFEPLRGVLLRFDDHNRETVIDTVRRLRQSKQKSPSPI